MFTWFGAGKLSLSISLLAMLLLGGPSAWGHTNQTSYSNNDNHNFTQVTSVTSQHQEPQAAHDDKDDYFKIITLTDVIPFNTVTTYDPSLAAGQTVVKVNGVNGVMTSTYRVKYDDGREVDRVLLSSVVTTSPVDKVIAIGTRKPNPGPCPLTASTDSVQSCCPIYRTTNSASMIACPLAPAGSM